MAVSQAANIGANFSDYVGNPNLGGSTLGVIKIDTRPLEDLAKYTMLYNRAEYEQRQKDAEAAAKEIADYTSYDLTTSISKDAKIIREGYDKLISFFKENPDAINYRNKEKWAEGKRLRNEFDNDLKMAKVRSVMNVAREKEIADETDEDLKKFKQQQLDAEINSTDIRTPIKYSQQFDLTVPDLGKNLGIKVDVTKTGSNQIFQRDFNLFDLSEARRAGAAAEIGFSNIDPNTTTGKLKMIKADQNLWVKASTILNQAIQGAKKEDGSIDESKLASLPILKNVNDFNKYIEQKRAEIASGVYKDKLGNVITFGVGPIREEDYQPINWQDGISPSELAVLSQYSQWAGDEYQTKVIQTDDAIQMGQQAIGWYNARTGRIQEDRMAKAAGVSNDMAMSAKVYAESLMNKLNGLKDAGGIITRDKFSKLTADELKYLGQAKTDENKFTLTPFSLTGINSLLIEDDGTIKAFTGNPTKGALGTQQGQSINISTIATNKLGDEMITTTGKEGYNFNNLIPLYQSATNESKPTNKQQKQVQVINGYEIPNGAKVVYSKKTGKALGYTLNGENYKF